MNDETQHQITSPPAAPADITTARLGAETEDALSQPQQDETLTQAPNDAARSQLFATTPAPHTIAVPGYEILGELGRGGMGVVYKARQVKLNRIVALKMVLSAQHADPRELIRFLEEAQAVAAIKHPHVIQVYDSGEYQGRPFMAMECLEGGSLVQRLRAIGKMEPCAAAELIIKIARGVQAAHDRGIIHRDLKPHNVLLDTPLPTSPPGTWGEPKVTDFGLAKRGGGAELTQTGAVMGTPAYMAPEQAKGETRNIGPAADIYALGIMLYECLSGTVPFTGDDAWSVIRQVVTDNPEPLTRRMPGVPRDLDLICRMCLEKAPADRYASAGALADDLQRYLNGEAIRGPRTGIWYEARRVLRRWWRPTAGLSALMILVLAAWVIPSPLDRFLHPKKEEQPKEETKLKEEDPLVKLRREEVLRRVDALQRAKLTPDRSPPHPITRVLELPSPDLAAFKVLSDDRIVDMRGWKPNLTADPNIDAAIVYQTKREMIKVAAANELRVEMRTSGRDVFMRALRPHPERVKAFAAEKPGFVGKQAMKVRQLIFDVSDVPLDHEFTLQFVNTYQHALQSPDEQWFGVIGYEGSFKTSMLMLFPANKPFRDYQLRVAATRVDDPTKLADPVPYEGPVIVFAAEDKSWLYWEIPTPKANYVYRIDWTW